MGNSALSPAIRRASGFSNEELSRLEKRFRKLDADSDGSVRYFILILYKDIAILYEYRLLDILI